MRITDSLKEHSVQLDDQLLRGAQLPIDDWSSAALDKQLSEHHASKGIDFATAWLYQALCNHPRHRDFVSQFEASANNFDPHPHGRQGMSPLPTQLGAVESSLKPDSRGRGHCEPYDIDHVAPSMTVCVVPGAFYQEYPRLDSSGQALRQQLHRCGISTELIPVKSTGSLAENARIIRSFLCERTTLPLALISLSKGSADIKFALQQSMEDFRNVRLWYSISGTLSGVELVNWVQRRWWARAANGLVFRMSRRDSAFFTDLARGPGSPLDFQLACPSQLTVVHVAAFALARHTRSRMARAWYRRCYEHGPTDSMIVLRELLSVPGYVLPVWGVDHYWKSPSAIRLIASGIAQHAQRLAACASKHSDTSTSVRMMQRTSRLPTEQSS